MEIIVELQFTSGEQNTKEYVGEDEKSLAECLTESDWFNFGDEYINMRNVNSFRVISKKRKEEEEAREREETARNVNAILGLNY